MAAQVVIAEAPTPRMEPRFGVINPEMFGAVSNAAVDSTNSFLRLRDHVERTGAQVRLSPGKYLLKQEIVFQGALSLEGAGIGATQIGWEGSAPGGIRVVIGSNEDHVRVAGVSLVRQSARASSTALHVDGKALVESGLIRPRVTSRLTVNEVEIRGASQLTESWQIGIHAESLIGVRLNSVDIFGSITQRPSQIDDTTGILFGGDGAAVEMNCVGLRIYTTRTAVDVFDAEGVYLLAPTLVQVGTGVRWRTTRSMKPHLVIRGGHIASIQFGIDARALSQADIDGVLFYQRPEALEGVHVRLSDGAFNKIGTNTFVGAKFDAIELAGGETRAMIAAQLFQLTRVGIKLGPETTNCVVAAGSLFGSVTGQRLQAGGSGHQLP